MQSFRVAARGHVFPHIHNGFLPDSAQPIAHPFPFQTAEETLDWSIDAPRSDPCGGSVTPDAWKK